MATTQPPVGDVERSSPNATAPAAPDAVEEVAGEIALSSSPEVFADTLGDFLRGWWGRVRGGESGMLPVIGALAAIIIIFQVQSSLFLSAGNIVNLLIQAAVIVLLGIGEVFVLLLGEIDLSVGYVAGVCGGLMAALVAPPFNAPWWVAILAALGGGAIIGLVHGTLITRLGLPSFIVTLAGLIGWEGVMIWMFDSLNVAVGGVISVSNKYLLDLVSGDLSPVAGWVVMAVLVVAFGGLMLSRDASRRRSGLVAPPLGLTVLKLVAAAVGGSLLVWVCNINRGINTATLHTVSRGVPWALPIIFAVWLLASFVLGRTRFGRYIYAIGGNAEAARRAGVNLALIRTAAFVIAGLMAAVAGIIYTSWLGSIATNIDGGTYVLYAVAAAVIGGTSLFGGRGKPLHAVAGGLVIGAIANGLALLGLGAAPTYIVTALVLVAAITVDSVARRGQASSARAKV